MKSAVRGRKTRKTKKQDVAWIVGVDEAGRGPLAGPVHVGVCAIPVKAGVRRLTGVTDSKKLSEKKRSEIYDYLSGLELVRCEVAYATAKTINKIGIVRSVERATKRALKKLGIPPASCVVLLDGGLKAPLMYVHQKTIVHGDLKEKIIGAASIIAKVRRDRMMEHYDCMYPEYGFSSNKGYGTKTHIRAIRRHGLTNLHREVYCRTALLHEQQKNGAK